MKNVLITGSAGYIGENLVNYLKSDKNITLSLIDKIWGKRVEDMKSVDADVVVHMAAMSNIADCANNIDGSIRDNIIATFNIFNLAAKQNIPIVFISTQASKTPEANLYAMQKRIMEVEAERLNAIGGDIKVIRLTNVYGGMYFLKKKKSVVANFINAIKNDEPIIINGNGEQIRDYVHVNDVCEAIYKCINYNLLITDPIDIGTGIETSVFELAKMTKGKYTFNEYSKMVGTMKNVGNTNNAEKIIGFKATKKIQEYIKEQLK